MTALIWTVSKYSKVIWNEDKIFKCELNVVTRHCIDSSLRSDVDAAVEFVPDVETPGKESHEFVLPIAFTTLQLVRGTLVNYLKENKSFFFQIFCQIDWNWERKSTSHKKATILANTFNRRKTNKKNARPYSRDYFFSFLSVFFPPLQLWVVFFLP